MMRGILGDCEPSFQALVTMDLCGAAQILALFRGGGEWSEGANWTDLIEFPPNPELAADHHHHRTEEETIEYEVTWGNEPFSPSVHCVYTQLQSPVLAAWMTDAVCVRMGSNINVAMGNLHIYNLCSTSFSAFSLLCIHSSLRRAGLLPELMMDPNMNMQIQKLICNQGKMYCEHSRYFKL